MVMTLKKDLEAQGEPLSWIQLINQCIINMDSLERDLKEVGKQLRYVRAHLALQTTHALCGQLISCSLQRESERKISKAINNASCERRARCLRQQSHWQVNSSYPSLQVS